jgi:hypothetical protein
MAIRKNITIKTDEQAEAEIERRIEKMQELSLTHGGPYAVAWGHVEGARLRGKKPTEIIDYNLSSLAGPVRRDDVAGRKAVIAVLSDRFGKSAVRKVAAKRAAVLRKEIQFLSAI